MKSKGIVKAFEKAGFSVDRHECGDGRYYFTALGVGQAAQWADADEVLGIFISIHNTLERGYYSTIKSAVQRMTRYQFRREVFTADVDMEMVVNVRPAHLSTEVTVWRCDVERQLVCTAEFNAPSEIGFLMGQPPLGVLLDWLRERMPTLDKALDTVVV